jgi:CheY-like chemotaxis protein
MMKVANKGTPVTILLVEDDQGDQELTRRALQESKIRNELHVAKDGEEALAYLFRCGKFKDPATSPRPDLLLLDLNLPRVDGRQVLERVRADSKLRRMAVVVLTTSRQEEDILRSYELGCNSFITKPVDMNQFMQAIHTLEEYWFQVVVLPPKTE